MARAATKPKPDAAPTTIKFAVRNRWTGEVLTAERLAEVVDYDPASGVFTYRIRTSQSTAIGSLAGSVNTEGYRHIRIDGRAYKAHRLAVLYMTGAWPVQLVDHINGSRDDNSWSNLRNATRSQNLANSSLNRKGKMASKGVRLCANGRWSARIQRDGISRFLGYFPSEVDAVATYSRAAKEMFGQYAKGSI